MDDYMDWVERFATRNDLTFGDWTLLRTALTHGSYLNEHPALDWEDNERLEYLGDAVLDFVLADYLYTQFPHAPEGELTGLRAALVRRATLARFARALGMGKRCSWGMARSKPAAESGPRPSAPRSRRSWARSISIRAWSRWSGW